ncbi:MAG: hypothetical protein U5K74_09255 [Gemmatimonadaceae bacterium]|nr:hypothetical protein [Gemmatimonadaceae bacterium]
MMGDAAGAADLHHLVRSDEGGGVLVEAEPDGERVEGERREQASESIALAEVLVDDDVAGEAEAGRHDDHAGARCGAFMAAGDHVRGHDGGAGAGAGHGHAGLEAVVEDLRCGRAAHDGRQAELVAARHEDAVRILEDRCPVAVIAVGPSLEIERAGVLHTVPRELLLVPAAHVRLFRGGGDDGDDRVARSAELDEPSQDGRVGQLPADRNEPAFAGGGRGHARKVRGAGRMREATSGSVSADRAPVVRVSGGR